MESTPLMYRTVEKVLSSHRNWLDLRHLKTLAWMINGLIQSGEISLGAWAIHIHSRAQYLASTIRRFRRLLDNERIQIHSLYAPLFEQALQGWAQQTIFVALDTSMLWNTYCIIRLSLIYRGRAVPIVWKIIEHKSASVAHSEYRALLKKAAQLLFPFHSKIIFLADRGFADTQLLKHLKNLGWHYRIRIKGNFEIYQKRQRPRKANRIPLAAGYSKFWHDVQITEKRFGPLHLALGRPLNSKDRWIVISDEPTGLETFQEFGLRFDIEENFLDDKSNGFQLESSLIRSAKALERLCLVLAIATLHLVSQGTQVVEAGKRRQVDAHWFRGSSYLKIGWNWVKQALSRKGKLTTRLTLSPKPDPEPAMASRIQHQKRSQPQFVSRLRQAA